MSKRRVRDPDPSEKTVLVLQGGGALGAYQAGVYEALTAHAHAPDWIAGISIGAVNAAIIAGNPPERRVERLRAFWERASSWLIAEPLMNDPRARRWFNEASASISAMFGVEGFFAPRFPPPFVFPAGSPQALSLYETHPLKRTLEDLVDFDLLNSGAVRLSVGAVNIRTGNFTYFDTARQRIGPEHIMASGALPPGFPPIEIDGEQYWDGGLVSNTPLQYVLDETPACDMLVFQVDLFSARGPMPRTLSEVAEREKDIRFSSRTRLNTDVFLQSQAARRAARRLIAKLPAALRRDPDAQALEAFGTDANVAIMHLIHRRKNSDRQSKDYEFSRRSVREHWRCGVDDVSRSLAHPDWLARKPTKAGVSVFDLAHSDPTEAAAIASEESRAVPAQGEEHAPNVLRFSHHQKETSQ